MPIEITMPRLSDTMETGTIISWSVNEGDSVAAGDVLADIETDKATMEMAVYDDGTIARILVGEGQSVDVGTVVAVLAEPGEDVTEVAGAAPSQPATAAEPASKPEPAPRARPTQPAPAPTQPPDGRMRVTNVARRIAEEHGIDLRSLQGTGPSGRIVKRDVLQAVEAGAETAAAVPPSALAAAPTPAAPSPGPAQPVVAAEPPAPGLGRIIPLSGMRQTIARRLIESTTTIPHYQVTVTFDMDPLLELRATLNEQLRKQEVKLSVNDLLVKACALAMYEHPEFNASWGGDHLVVHADVNVGVAVSIPTERGGGLVVATIRNADRKSLRLISAETRQLAEKARTRGLSLEEMSGATFTISNLGMFGVDNFTAIINPPNSAILAVGAAIQKPVVRDGALAIGHEMSATLSSDHRVIDGAMAARYLQTLKDMIETPGLLLV